MKKPSTGQNFKFHSRSRKCCAPRKTIILSAILGALVSLSCADQSIAKPVKPEIPQLDTTCSPGSNCLAFEEGSKTQMELTAGTVHQNGFLHSHQAFGFDSQSATSSDGNMVIVSAGSYYDDPNLSTMLEKELAFLHGFAQTTDGDANNNTVYINTQDRIGNPVLMRYIGNPDVDDSDVQGSIAGASAITGSMDGNRVVSEDSFIRAWSIYGAYRTNAGTADPAATATLTNNAVLLKNPNIVQSVFTGFASEPFITDPKHGGVIAAASSGLGGNHGGGHEVRAENNTLVIEGGAVSFGRLAGFVAGDGEYSPGDRDYFVANNNGVFIEGVPDFYFMLDPDRVGYLYGHHGFAGENAAGQWQGELNGGYVDVRGSQINIYGSEGSSLSIAGGHTGSKLLNNSVEIFDSVLEVLPDYRVESVIEGAYANTYHENAAVEIVADGNWVTLDKTEQRGEGWAGAYGAQVYGKTLGGDVLAGAQVTNNRIEVRNNSAILSTKLVGAWLDAKPTTSDQYTLMGNSVSIENSTFEGTEIVAAQVGDLTDLGEGTVENNVVRIGEGVTKADGSTLSLDYLAGGAAASAQTSYENNRLVLGSRAQTKKLIGFQDFEFNLNDQTLAAGQALLTVTDAPVVLATTASEHLGG